MLKENVYNAVMEQLAPIVRKRLNEVSDELLMRAYNAGMQRNSGLEKRRARKFLDWLNDPRRKELKDPTLTPRDKHELRALIEKEYEKNPRKLDLNHIDTHKVTDMAGLFSGLSQITNVYIDKWDTSNVTTMAGMFYNCQRLRNVYINEWNTGSVTDMQFMFARCHRLQYANILDINTGSVRNMSGMFYMCDDLINLYIKDWDVSAVEDMSMMFYYCSNLKNIILNRWNTNSLRNTYAMFAECHSLEDLCISKWNVDSVISMASMFSNCESLRRLNIFNWNTEDVRDISHIFYGTKSLTKLLIRYYRFDINSETNTFEYAAYANRAVLRIPLFKVDEIEEEQETEVETINDINNIVDKFPKDVIDENGEHYILADALGSRGSTTYGLPPSYNKRKGKSEFIELFDTPKEVFKKYNCHPTKVMAVYVVITKQRKTSEYWPVKYFYDDSRENVAKGAFNDARNYFLNYIKNLEDFDVRNELFNYELTDVNQKIGPLENRVSACCAYKKKGTKGRGSIWND